MEASSAAWLTTVLRPAGSLDPVAVRRLAAALGGLAGASDMVLLDLTAAVGRAVELGGTVVRGRTELPTGSVAVVSDPGGATVALWQERGQVG